MWRLFVLEDLQSFPVKLNNLIGAGEPLNPEIIDKVRKAWGITIRDGFGQTETVLTLANFPGQKVKPGAVGMPSPGHHVVLLDAEGNEANDGEIAIKCDPRPISLMPGYMGDDERTAKCFAGGYYRTGDVAHRDEEGYYTYIGRADDVFKSSDYRLSPFELESALIEHQAIAEAAVVPSPDPIRWTVPKAFIICKPGVQPTAGIGARHLQVHPRTPRTLQAHPPPRVLRSAQDHLRQDSPRATARIGAGGAPAARPPSRRVLGRGLPGTEGRQIANVPTAMQKRRRCGRD